MISNKFGSTKNQYISVLLVNLTALSYGNISGWLSPALLTLNSENTPFIEGPLTTEQVSWVASVVFIGAALALLACGKITEKYGNRFALIGLGVPQLIFWTLIGIGDSYWYLIVARFCVGFTAGTLFKVVPYYVAEISQKHIRGRLGSIMPLFFNVGILLGFIIGAYVPYKIIPISICIPIIYLVMLILYIPETPQFLLSQNRNQEALESLCFYRSVNSQQKAVPKEVQKEFDELLFSQNSINSNGSSELRALFTQEARYGMLMSLFLMALMHCTGVLVLSMFTSTIFVESGSSLPPNTSAIIIATVQVLAVYASFFFIDKFGRKTLLLTACAGSSISLGALGTYAYLDKNGFDLAEFNWIPIVCFSVAIFLISMGLLATLLTIVTEILIPEIKNYGFVVTMLTSSFWGFLILKLFPIMLVKIQIYGVMWFFSASAAVGFVVCSIFLIETKGKNLNKI